LLFVRELDSGLSRGSEAIMEESCDMDIIERICKNEKIIIERGYGCAGEIN
jgi:hypothetical protein